MDKQPVGQLPDLTQSNNDDEIMVITNDEYNQLKKEKISDFITDLTSTDADNSLVKGDDGKLFVSKTINASDVDGVLSLDNIPQLSTNKLPETGISADNYSYPSSITVNDRGQVVSIVEGSAAEAGAYLDQSQITNCLLSVPQLVPQPVVADNTLTFSQGLTVIVPYGKTAPTLEVGGSLNGGEIVDISWDGQNLFYLVKYGAKTYNKNKTNNADEYVLMNAAGALSGLPFDYAFSSSTEPEVTTQYAIWYDSANNIVKWSADTGSSWVNYYSLPFAAISYSGSGTSYDISGVKTLYNGIKFIDSAIFVDKGIKILIPAGRNPDGTLKNTEYEFTDVGVYTVTDNVTGEYWVRAGGSNFVGRLLKTWWKYDFVNNYIVGGNGEIARSAMVGEFSISSGKITSFKPYNTFHAIDYNEAVKRSGDTITGTLTVVNNGYPRLAFKNQDYSISDGSNELPSDIGFGQMISLDKNNATAGVFQTSVSKADDNYFTNFGLRRIVDGATKASSAGLSIPASGTRIFYFDVDTLQHNGTTIRYVKQSYVNGTSWYRVWSDGWIEQGGKGAINGTATTTLPKKFSNANYTLVVTLSGAAGNRFTAQIIDASKAAASFQVYCANPEHYYWYACGF